MAVAQSPTLQSAEYYVKRGWAVFPVHSLNADGTCDCGNPNCSSPGKHPWLKEGFKGATKEIDQSRQWFTQTYPGANIAIVTGQTSGIVVLDVDSDHGGDDTLADLIRDHGKLPETIEAKSGGGGRHIFFAHPGIVIPNSAGKVGPGLDIRGDGGYVVGSPSRHKSGLTYTWETSSLPSKTKLAPMPTWLIDLAKESTEYLNGKANGAVANGTTLIEGMRNNSLYSLAGTMRRRGMTPFAIEAALLIDNRERGNPPLPEDEVRDIAKSILRHQPADVVVEWTGEGNEPFLRKEGDTLTWLWPSRGVGVGIDMLRENVYGLSGELTVQAVDQHGGLDKTGHIHTSRFNLSAMDDRTKLIKILATKREGIDWAGMVEIVCYRTIEQWRNGDPTVNLANVIVPHTVPYAIDRMLPLEQTSLIFADGGVGKSWFALALAVAFRTGLPLPAGLRPLATGPVLYLDWESEAEDHARRLEWLCRGFGIAKPDIEYRKMVRSLPDDAPQLRKMVKTLDIRFVIVDSIAPACGGKPEDASTMTETFNALRTLAPATRLILSHVSRAGADQSKGIAHPFGSVFTRNLSRSVWELRRAESSDEIAMFHRKANNGPLEEPIGLRLQIDHKNYTARITEAAIEAPELAAHGSMRFRILAALRGGPMTTNQLSSELGIPDNHLRATITRMSDEVVKMPSDGRMSTWGLATEGDDGERF